MMSLQGTPRRQRQRDRRAEDLLPGIEIENGAHDNLIGGRTTADRNLISGNDHNGVLLRGNTTLNNRIEGNIVGSNRIGTGALPNRYVGIELFEGAHHNTVGGTASGAGNVVSANNYEGIRLNGTGVANNTIQGNTVGLDATGNGSLGNGFFDVPTHQFAPGIGIYGGASFNRVGGTSTGARNVISANAAYGVAVSGNGTDWNVVEGNVIGLDATGTVSLGNGFADPPNFWLFSGVAVYGMARNNLIGGTVPGARNYICASGSSGVLIADSGTDQNRVEGNTIGLTPKGTMAGNSYQGVSIFGGAKNNVIGGTAPGAGNRITRNGGNGISLFDAITLGNQFRRNSIRTNAGNGIGLYSGSNNAQAAPTLATAVLGPVGNANGTNVSGNLVSLAGSTFVLEFFATPAGDPSEGRHYLGTTNVTTNGTGFGSFSTNLTTAVPPAHLITATATSLAGNSSGFSTSRTVTTTDTDSDGLPDAFESLYSANTTAVVATADSDGDGYSNIAEFRAGTSPLSVASHPGPARLTRNGTGFTLVFPTVAGRVYRIDESTDLGRTDPWEVLLEPIVGTGSDVSIQIPDVTGQARWFFQTTALP